MSRIIGIDPGLASTGWGVIDCRGNRYIHVEDGTIKTPSDLPMAARLKLLYAKLNGIITRLSPEQAGVESIFFAKNTATAIPVAHARGVILLALAASEIQVGEYPPQMIKQSIVGIGRAKKEQVQELVLVLLGRKEKPMSDHAADALAAAICHYNSTALSRRLGS
ncbi:MAG: crossover junction endodeoxyribonuclease RuvC [Spirochaetia bacterium]